MGKVGIIGLFGSGAESYDGQTVKTKNLKRLLKENTDFEITEVNTGYFRKKPFRLLMDTILCMFKCRHIFLLVSVNGMNFYLRFFYIVNRIFRRHIYHYIIGSELLGMVEKNPGLVKYLNSLEVNWFEYESGTGYLREKGVRNVYTLPNMKMISPVAEVKKYIPEEGVYRFCTFSRVMREKGITDAIEAIGKVNKHYGRNIVHLDVYGQVNRDYEEEFAELVRKNSDSVGYKGTVDSFSSVDTLKNYYALLFPTKWPGEGVPGTVIDAFASGIPVIATDWNANREIIDNGQQGIVYPNEEIRTLDRAIMWAVENGEKMYEMGVSAREKFEEYRPERIYGEIKKKMESAKTD